MSENESDDLPVSKWCVTHLLCNFLWVLARGDSCSSSIKKKYVLVLPIEFTPRSNQIAFCDRLTFFQNDEACPPGPSTQAKSERSKCFKIAVWPQHRGGPHTPSLILLHISVGIVRIQKCSALTGRPFWLEKTHNALYCCCELLTAWAGPHQWRAALRSRQRGGIFDISPWWQPCYYSRFVLYASSLCGPTSPVATQNLIWMTNTFRLWSVDCFGKLHPACTQIEARAVIFNDCLTHAGRECILQGHIEHGYHEVSEALF